MTELSLTASQRVGRVLASERVASLSRQERGELTHYANSVATFAELPPHIQELVVEAEEELEGAPEDALQQAIHVANDARAALEQAIATAEGTLKEQSKQRQAAQKDASSERTQVRQAAQQQRDLDERQIAEQDALQTPPAAPAAPKADKPDKPAPEKK